MPEIKKLSWDEYIQMIYDLGAYIDRSEGFINNISGIYGVPRGGLIIATLLSHKHNVPLITNPSAVFNDKRILVVDDIADSGKTLVEFKEVGLKIACLHINPGTMIMPDYYLRTNEGMWIGYPYEMEGDTVPQYMIQNSFSATYPENSASPMPGDIQLR